MSDEVQQVQLWEAPFFAPTDSAQQKPEAAEREALAQARGFQLGKQEGLEAGLAEGEAVVSSLKALAERLSHPFHDLDEIVTRELSQMTMLLAEQIVRRELLIDSSVVKNVVEEALSVLYKLDGEVVIFVNPADVKLLEDFAPDALEGKTWKIVEDAELFPGGCQVKTPTSFVDASVERRIEGVFASLVEATEQDLGS